MDKLESNIVKSFRLAKKDINELKNRVIMLSQEYEEAMKELSLLRSSAKTTKTKTQIVKVVRPKTTKSRSKTFVAAKEGKKFHIKECPYAQNIKPKTMVKFKSKNAALNKGYKPCQCIK